MFGMGGEILLRLNPKLFCEGYRASPDDRIVYELYPGYEIKSLKAKISSQGLNDRYFSVQKNPAIFRMAIVGDSTSFGWKVGAENSFPKVLERLLNSNDEGQKFEVINFSVPGYNTSQEAEVIRRKVLPFHPDLVVLIFCGNDVHLCNFIKPNQTRMNFFYNQSYLIHGILRFLDGIFMQMKTSFFVSKGILQAWLWFKNHVLGMFYYNQPIYPYPGLERSEMLKGFNPSRDPMQVPSRYWYMLGYDSYKVHLGNIKDLLKQYGIPWVSSGEFTKKALQIQNELGIENKCDFYEARKGISKKEIVLGEYDKHYNKKGHELMAGYLYDFLIKHNLLDSQKKALIPNGFKQ